MENIASCRDLTHRGPHRGCSCSACSMARYVYHQDDIRTLERAAAILVGRGAADLAGRVGSFASGIDTCAAVPGGELR